MKIIIPSNCPSCGEKLQTKNQILYCINNSCPAKGNKSIQHFSKYLKIKGLGPASIQKLQLQSYFQVLSLQQSTLISKLSSQVLGSKLYSSIIMAKNNKLNNLLPAFGIPLIGNTATEKLSKTITSIHQINEQSCQLANIGPKATSNLISWLQNNIKLVQDTFPQSMLTFQKTNNTSNGQIVCISGRLNSFKTKAQATKLLTEKGYKVKPSLTKQVTILVNQSGIQTLKTTKARQSGVLIINNLNTFLKGE